MNLRNILFAAAALLGMASCSDKDNHEPEAWGTELTVKSEIALAADRPQILNIQASATPVLTTDAAWLHLGEVHNTGKNIYSLEIRGDVSSDGTERTANIEVTAGAAKKTVRVIQHAGDYVAITAVEPSAVLEAAGGTLTVRYTATAQPAVTLPEWMSTAGGRALTEGELRLSYNAALLGAREGEIVLTVGKASAAVTVSQAKAEAGSEMGSTPQELAVKMHNGVNIGNTMEATGGEGSWSPKVNAAYVAGLRNLGFNAVRIPFAVDQDYIVDRENNTIDPAWLDRIDEVVSWVVGHGMYAIVNIHWDGGWLENTCKNGYDEKVDKKQHDYWTQIASKLNHYDEHLLLAAMNEPNATDNTGIDAIMAYQQTMLDAVRATGGNNATRVLIMQAPETNIDKAVAGHFHMPEDIVDNRLMVEVHFYDPYQFNMMETDANWGKTHWYWGSENFVTGSDRNSPHGESDVRTQMQKIKKAYVDKGIPGIIGEYAVCCNRSNQSGIDKARWAASVTLWNRVVVRESINAGLVPFFWEIGADISRIDGTAKSSTQLDGIAAGAAEGIYPY